MSVSKYPWSSWFGQKHTVIRRGVDYKISQSMMYQTIRNNASARGLRVKIEDNNDSLTIEVIGDKTSEVLHTNQVTVPAQYANAVAGNGLLEEEAAQGNTNSHEQGTGDGTTTIPTFSRDYNPPRPTPFRR